MEQGKSLCRNGGVGVGLMIEMVAVKVRHGKPQGEGIGDVSYDQ